MLVFNPKCAYLPVLAEQIRVRPDQLKMDIAKTINECSVLVKNNNVAAKFEVRLIEMIPGYSMVISDPYQSNGHMIVEYYGYRSTLNARPHVELDVASSRRWFDYYLNQYEELWNSATPYKFDVLPV